MKSLIRRLGARAFEERGASVFTAADFESQTDIRLLPELASLLEEIRGPVFFDDGANFIPSSPSGREYHNGYRSLDILYGFTNGTNGLAKRHTMTKEDLPSGVIAIGEAPGGDQICVDIRQAKFCSGSMTLNRMKQSLKLPKILPHFSNRLLRTPRPVPSALGNHHKFILRFLRNEDGNRLISTSAESPAY